MANLEKMGYRFIGRHKHSAVKVCEWCRKAIREQSVCYKQKFYGIKSHRCIQMSPAVFSCTQNCQFCWRTHQYQGLSENQKWDQPEAIVKEMIDAHKELLKGFGGNPKVNSNIYEEAMKPNQVAISLAGEPTVYPFLPGFINEIHNNNMTSFLVTNGTIPGMIEKLRQNPPTQLYTTLAAPNQEVYQETCAPLIENAWESLMKTLSLLKYFQRSVIRLTLVKELNMTSPEQYAEIIENTQPTVVELKAFMSIGGARERLPITRMPRHSEIVSFAKQIEQRSSYQIIDEKTDSRVVLLAKNGKYPEKLLD